MPSSAAVTTTTAQAGPTTTTLTPVDLPDIDPGGASALVGGESVTASITRSDNQLVVTAGPIAVKFRATAAAGGQIPLDQEGRLRLNVGDSVNVEAKGFDVDSFVEVRLYSDPVLLGRSRVNQSGSLIGSYEIPVTAPTGDHTVVLVGKNEGKSATFSLSIAVGEKEDGLNPLIIIFPIGLAILGALVLPVALKRRREAR